MIFKFFAGSSEHLSTSIPGSPSCLSSTESVRSQSPATNSLTRKATSSVASAEPTPTADLDRSNDKTYECTTNVVKAVMCLSQGVQQSHADQYLDLVRKVGLELRMLLSSVDGLVDLFNSAAKREVELAHKVNI